MNKNQTASRKQLSITNISECVFVTLRKIKLTVSWEDLLTKIQNSEHLDSV